MGKEINMCEDGLDLRGCPEQGFIAWGRPHASFLSGVCVGRICVSQWDRGVYMFSLSLMELMLAYFGNTLGVYPVWTKHGIHSGIHRIEGSVNFVWTTALKNEITGNLLSWILGSP